LRALSALWAVQGLTVSSRLILPAIVLLAVWRLGEVKLLIVLTVLSAGACLVAELDGLGRVITLSFTVSVLCGLLPIELNLEHVLGRGLAIMAFEGRLSLVRIISMGLIISIIVIIHLCSDSKTPRLLGSIADASLPSLLH